MKKAILLVLVLLITIPGMANAATKDISVYLNGKKIQFSSKPISAKKDYLVPSRSIFPALGAKYSFDSKTHTVKATRKDLTIQLIVDQTVAFRNGNPVNLTDKPKLISGVLYVPLRFISESFGYSMKTKGNRIYLTSPATTNPPVSKPTENATPKEIELTTEQIGKLSDRVVYIEVYGENGQPLASGSGVVVGSEGEIITNYHVIDGATSARIDFNDQRSFTTSTLLIQDADRDLALLKIGTSSLTTVTLGDSSTLNLGEEVVAIGSPLGFKNSLTSGVVSTTTRVLDGHEFIQISTPIDHGSSGGALFNKKGELVGITTALIESSAAINLAIPSNDVKVFLAKNKIPQALSISKPKPAQLSADDLTNFLNSNYSVITYEDLTLHFEWQVFMSDDGDRYLIGGTIHDLGEWADWIGYQINDETVFPSMIFYMSEELRNNLGINNSFFTLYLNSYVDFYPSSFPASSIRSEYPGYRLDYNFIYGSMDYSTGYLYYNLTSENVDANKRLKMK